jgi:hypothetical protein
MPRSKDPNTRTAPEIIADVLEWAERKSFKNGAAALRRALDLMPKDAPRTKPKRGKAS